MVSDCSVEFPLHGLEDESLSQIIAEIDALPYYRDLRLSTPSTFTWASLNHVFVRLTIIDDTLRIRIKMPGRARGLAAGMLPAEIVVAGGTIFLDHLCCVYSTRTLYTH